MIQFNIFGNASLSSMLILLSQEMQPHRNFDVLRRRSKDLIPQIMVVRRATAVIIAIARGMTHDAQETRDKD